MRLGTYYLLYMHTSIAVQEVRRCSSFQQQLAADKLSGRMLLIIRRHTPHTKPWRASVCSCKAVGAGREARVQASIADDLTLGPTWV